MIYIICILILYIILYHIILYHIIILLIYYSNDNISINDCYQNDNQIINHVIITF